MTKKIHRKRSTRNTSRFCRKQALRSAIRSDNNHRSLLFNHIFHNEATRRQDSLHQDGCSRANFINLYSFPSLNLSLHIDSSIHMGSRPPIGFSANCGCRVLDDNTYQWCEECNRNHYIYQRLRPYFIVID
ncbi:unnamed protein product [Rhizophagus irregularis]|nr:unnamed protein product [Rhizophagus irregularis]